MAKKITPKTNLKTVVKQVKSNVNLGKVVNRSEGKASSTVKFAAELKPRIKPKK